MYIIFYIPMHTKWGILFRFEDILFFLRKKCVIEIGLKRAN